MMEKPEHRVLVVGGIGHGKSSFINSIVEKYACKAGVTWGVDKTVTKCITKIDLEQNDDVITFFDTPSLKALKSNREFQDLYKTGFHAIVIVISMKSYKRQSPVLHKAEKLFGDELYRHALIVFTFADYLGESSVDEFLRANPELKEFLKKTEDRYISFDGSLQNDSKSASDQRNRFLTRIENVFRRNDDELITRKGCCADIFTSNYY